MEYARSHLFCKCCLLGESLGYITVRYFNFFVSRTGIGEFIPAVSICQVSPNPCHFLGNLKVAVFFGHHLEQKNWIMNLHPSSPTTCPSLVTRPCSCPSTWYIVTSSQENTSLWDRPGPGSTLPPFVPIPGFPKRNTAAPRQKLNLWLHLQYRADKDNWRWWNELQSGLHRHIFPPAVNLSFLFLDFQLLFFT